MLYGAVSWGGVCAAPDQPGLYTRVNRNRIILDLQLMITLFLTHKLCSIIYDMKILYKSYYDWIYTLTRYTRKLQLKTNDVSNDVASTNNARPPILGPSGNQEQTEINAAAHCKKFLMLICALVLILI